jgi:transposase-like protein
MDPQTQFGHNPDCPARGQTGQRNIRIHSQKDRRFQCRTCGQTFAATRGTPFDRLKTPTDVVTIVRTLPCHGGPLQAIVAAFGLDERTIALGPARAGQHSRRLHEHLVPQGQVDLQHVQADEMDITMAGRRVWMALAMAVPSRLWWGGVISRRRDLALITALVQKVRSWARSLAILACADGLASYVTAFTQVFRHAIHPAAGAGLGGWRSLGC